MNNIPIEHDEAVKLVEWCQWRKVDLWHLPQETYTKSWAAKAKNKKEGVRKGVSDYLVFIPAEKCVADDNILLFIELKRQKPILKNGKEGKPKSKPTKEQIDFLNKVRTVIGVGGGVAYGADEAIDYISKFLKDKK